MSFYQTTKGDLVKSKYKEIMTEIYSIEGQYKEYDGLNVFFPYLKAKGVVTVVADQQLLLVDIKQGGFGYNEYDVLMNIKDKDNNILVTLPLDNTLEGLFKYNLSNPGFNFYTKIIDNSGTDYYALTEQVLQIIPVPALGLDLSAFYTGYEYTVEFISVSSSAPLPTGRNMVPEGSNDEYGNYYNRVPCVNGKYVNPLDDPDEVYGESTGQYDNTNNKFWNQSNVIISIINDLWTYVPYINSLSMQDGYKSYFVENNFYLKEDDHTSYSQHVTETLFLTGELHNWDNNTIPKSVALLITTPLTRDPDQINFLNYKYFDNYVANYVYNNTLLSVCKRYKDIVSNFILTSNPGLPHIKTGSSTVIRNGPKYNPDTNNFYPDYGQNGFDAQYDVDRSGITLNVNLKNGVFKSYLDMFQ
jgi:hypothetical protein